MRARTVPRPVLARTALLAIAALLASGTARAHPGITGYSGKPYNGTSETCTTSCHAKGANPPTLTITVPTTVHAGSTSQVTIVVAGNRTRTSLNAAFSDGVKTTKGTNTDTPLAAQEPTEIAAVAPPPSGASATYKFSFVAPSVPGAITMYVAGMAASGGGTGGDAVSTTTRAITVTATDAGAPSDAGSSSGGDASASGGTSGASGTSGTSGTSGSTDGGSSGGASGASGASSGDAPGGSADSGESSGCAVAQAPGPPGRASLLGLSVLLGLCVINLRRRNT